MAKRKNNLLGQNVFERCENIDIMRQLFYESLGQLEFVGLFWIYESKIINVITHDEEGNEVLLCEIESEEYRINESVSEKLEVKDVSEKMQTVEDNQDKKSGISHKDETDLRVKKKLKQYSFEKIKLFLVANRSRGLTREEICNFLHVTTFKNAKEVLSLLGLDELGKSVIIDLRSSNKPEGAPIFPSTDQKKEDETPGKSMLSKSEPNVKEETEVSDISDESQENQEICDTDKQVQGAVPKNTGQTPFKMNELFNSNSRKKYLIDPELLEMMNYNDFKSMLYKMTSYNILPIFLVFRGTLEYLDIHKNDEQSGTSLAQGLLKFFAIDRDFRYHKYVEGKSPTRMDMISYCKKNGVHLISGNIDIILNAKISGVNVFIPDFILNQYPNPFKGSGFAGFDTSTIFYSDSFDRNKVNNILSKYEGVLLPDLVVQESDFISTKKWENVLPYLLVICALYGNFGKAPATGFNNDARIVEFYKNNPVKTVYTADYGFCNFAHMSNISCFLLLDVVPQSELLNVLRRKDSFYNYYNRQIMLDTEIFTNGPDKTVHVRTDNKNYIISVFTKDGVIRKGKCVILAYPTDVVVMRKDNNILIFNIIDKQRGGIMYWGDTNKVPKKLRKWL